MLFAIVLSLLVFLFLLNLLRAILSTPLPSALSLADKPGKLIHPLIEPLFDERHAQLSDLGFRLVSHAEIRMQPRQMLHAGVMRFYRSADGLTLAEVFVTLELEEADRARVYLASRNDSGKMLVTAPWDAFNAAQGDSPLGAGQLGFYATLEEQYAAHQSFIAPHALQPWPDDSDCVAIINAYEAAMLNVMRERGIAVTHGDGGRRLSLKAALKMLGKIFSVPKTAAATEVRDVPLPRLALLWEVWKKRRAMSSPRLAVQWGLFLFSALAFVALGAWVWHWQTAALLLLVLVLHEGGHWLAMRALGYQRVQILLLPLAGGVTLGEEEQISARDRAIVALAGPLPGLVLGVVLLMNEWAWTDGVLLHAAFLLIFINALNLLPVMPLDGGHVLQNLLPQQGVLLSLLFCLFSVIGLGALAWWLHSSVLLFVALLPLSTLFDLRRQHARLQQWRSLPAPENALAERIQALTIIQESSATPLKIPALVMQAEALLKTVNLAPMPLRSRVIVLGVWLMAWGLLLLPDVSRSVWYFLQ